MIFDFGGGTFDASLLSIEDGGAWTKATNGNTHLGGQDIDNKLIEFCRKDFFDATGHDIVGNKRAMQRLRTACEKAKIALSTADSAPIEVEVLAVGEDYRYIMQRTKLEELCMDIFKECLNSVEKVIKDSDISKNQIDEIILVGGSTRIPKIKLMLTEFFDGKPLNKCVPPDEAIV